MPGKASAFYRTPEWQALRIQALTRDFYECQPCRRNGKAFVRAVVVHHIKPRDKFPELARIERHIALTVKGIIASAAGYFLTARVLESMVPIEYQEDYREALAEARRRGIDYVKLNAREMEEQLAAGWAMTDDVP